MTQGGVYNRNSRDETKDLTWSYKSLQGLLYIEEEQQFPKRTTMRSNQSDPTAQGRQHTYETQWHDKPSVKGNIQLGSQSRQIRVLILSLGQSPRSPGFPTASKTGVPDTPSVLAFCWKCQSVTCSDFISLNI